MTFISRFRRPCPGKKGRLPAILASVLVLAAPAAANAGTTEQIYAGGSTYSINTGAAVRLSASPGMLAQSAPFYIIGFPVAAGTTGPITLPSGYQPQNNGLPAPIRYHDHIAADVDNPLRRVVQLRYSRAYAFGLDFQPLTSVAQLTLAEATGVLDIVDPAAADPYQQPTGTVLVRPVVSARG